MNYHPLKDDDEEDKIPIINLNHIPTTFNSPRIAMGDGKIPNGFNRNISFLNIPIKEK